MKFALMAIPAMALLQQHDARRDIVIEQAARRRAAIEARGHSELRAFGTGGVRNWGRNPAVKTHRLVTGSIARSATCPYFIYSEADFEVFRPAGVIRCPDWG